MAGAYEWLIGTRYLRSAHRRGFVSFVALISVSGLTLGVATLIVVLSVMNGFERELRTRILSVTAHATLSGLDGALADWHAAVAAALRQPGVLAAVPYIDEQAMLSHGQHIAGAGIRGVLPEEEERATGLAQHLTAGRLTDLEPGQYRIILGTALARELGARVGDDVVLVAPEGTATPTGLVPRMRRFRVVGLFESGMYEFDRGLALVHLADAARLYRLGDRVSGIRLALADPQRAPRTVRALALALGGGFYVSDWTHDHANFFRSIQITKSMLFVILLMLVAVAAFNIVATLVMIVKEKQTDIAISAHPGCRPGQHPHHLRHSGCPHWTCRHALRRRPRHPGGAQSAGAGGRLGARAAHAVSRCAGVFHERAAGLRGRHRHPAGVLGRLRAVRAGDGVSRVARGAHHARGGAAP
jgi:lipoprotein-releasing system permease protein